MVFFIDDVIDVPLNIVAISVENNNLENKEDALLHEKDSVIKLEVNKKFLYVSNHIEITFPLSAKITSLKISSASFLNKDMSLYLLE